MQKYTHTHFNEKIYAVIYFKIHLVFSSLMKTTIYIQNYCCERLENFSNHILFGDTKECKFKINQCRTLICFCFYRMKSLIIIFWLQNNIISLEYTNNYHNVFFFFLKGEYPTLLSYQRFFIIRPIV